MKCEHGIRLDRRDCPACSAEAEFRLARIEGRRKATFQEANDEFRAACRVFGNEMAKALRLERFSRWLERWFPTFSGKQR